MVFLCHMIQKDYKIKQSYHFIGVNSIWLVIILVVIPIVAMKFNVSEDEQQVVFF